MNVRLTKDQKVKLLYPEDIYKVMQQVLLRENKIRRNQEHFWVIGLDNKKKILFIELVALGRVNRVNVNPPDVFRMGIYKLAVTMVLVHNHPSGDVKPSKADHDFTDRILKVGKLINIDVIDHLVISEETFYSFSREGIIDKLKSSGLYEVVDREKAVMTKMKIEAEQRKEALTIAAKMKKDGLDEKTIKKYTGLYMHEIRGL
ncbi:MAG: JAB domain-containing protein [Roseivirga sp.]|nr:JAB domain-containing protein [Roseivirga sp.]